MSANSALQLIASCLDLKREGKKASPLGIECYHVNANFAADIADLGRFRPGKVVKLFRFIGEALWCRFRYGASNFYYVPAPNLKTPVIRDWIILLLCRPFFRRTIFYWHAAGLGEKNVGTPRASVVRFVPTLASPVQ